MLKLCVYIPETHLESVKQALFSAGAGKIGDYDSCAWQVLGQGQFRPLVGSQPYIGQKGQIEMVDEYRVEMVLQENCLLDVIDALIDSHPYETPAYDVVQVLDVHAYLDSKPKR
ncbi:Nif3-like dinuclear metal center hexameric protein [Thiomicrorhabdus heinhorstiae]|uniref:YqfO family protein n=1 Tax=Thiomicrorhabdus heinhorstiae TaxID=2748010 RepID=A0ABS0BX12_9GAMM|nr:YqfO family protein [Thiomicrorhabdus heinhorstiae]MBF6058347.1 YqfO family protein [Thiomicrorhabdus heinhorstiae]